MWRDADDRYNLVVGVSNLTDEKYMVTGYVQPNFGNFEALYARGREWYVTARYRF
jgi:iron complex outermembrane receptor protein